MAQEVPIQHEGIELLGSPSFDGGVARLVISSGKGIDIKGKAVFIVFVNSQSKVVVLAKGEKEPSDADRMYHSLKSSVYWKLSSLTTIELDTGDTLVEEIEYEYFGN